MNFWKRFRWIGSGLLILFWLIAVTAQGWVGESVHRVKTIACTTNCL
ncbi:hypothetical protein [Rhizobacter fulvus]|jgi:hypothetical protein